MTISRLVRSREQMWSDLLVALGGSDSYKTMSEEEMLAAIRNTYGGSVSALTTSESDLLAGIVGAAGGSTSVLTQDEERMLAALATALGGSGSALTSSSDALLAASVNAAGGGGGGYLGPLDIASGAVAAFGQRALSAAKRGSALYTIRRISDNSSQDFASDATTGEAPVTAIEAFIGTSMGMWSAVIVDGGTGYDGGSPSSFDVVVEGGTFDTTATVNVTTDGGGVVVSVNSTTPGQYSVAPSNPVSTSGDDGTNHGSGLTLKVFFGLGLLTTWNDQVAGNDLVAGASPPLWQPNVLGLHPAVIGSNEGSALAASTPVTFPNGGVTVFVVSGYDTEFQFRNIDDGSYIDFYMGREGLAPYVDMGDAASNEAGGNYPLPSDTVHLVDAAWGYGSAIYFVDGVEITQTGSFDSGGALSSMTCTADFAIDLNGPITDKCLEFIIYPSILSDAERSAIRQNIADYYDIPLE